MPLASGEKTSQWSHTQRGWGYPWSFGHSLCCHTARVPQDGGGAPSWNLFRVWSEWHLHSILVHMTPTEALYSGFRLSGTEMRMGPWLSHRRIFVCAWMRAQRDWRQRCKIAYSRRDQHFLCRSSFPFLWASVLFPKSLIADENANALLVTKVLFGVKQGWLFEECSNIIFQNQIKAVNWVDVDHSLAGIICQKVRGEVSTFLHLSSLYPKQLEDTDPSQIRIL